MEKTPEKGEIPMKLLEGGAMEDSIGFHSKAEGTG